MKINGACLCGDISWEARIDPALVGVCHCTDCQTVGGSAFQFTTRVAREDFHLNSGELTAYIKTAESGNPRAMSFCGRCATMIHTGNTDDTGLLSLRLGAASKSMSSRRSFRFGVNQEWSGSTSKPTWQCLIKADSARASWRVPRLREAIPTQRSGRPRVCPEYGRSWAKRPCIFDSSG